jgi:hypothetical protein
LTGAEGRRHNRAASGKADSGTLEPPMSFFTNFLKGPRKGGWLAAALSAVVLAVLLLAGCGGGDSGGNDDAAKLARNQTAGSCDAPQLPPTTLTPLGLNPLGIATLTAQPEPGEGKGTPSDQVSAEVVAAARNFVNCWNQRRFADVVSLTTEAWHKAHFVLKNPSDLIFAAEGSPDIPFTVHSIDDPQKASDGRVSVHLKYLWVHAEIAARWYFVKENGRWYFDQEEREPVDLGVKTTVINMKMTEFAYQIDTPTVKQSDAITIKAQNIGGLPHEMFLVQLSSSFDPSKLFQKPTQPEGVEFFGHLVEESGKSGEVTITGMKPGNYVMVCQFRFPGGDIPTHSAHGMVAVLTVTE